MNETTEKVLTEAQMDAAIAKAQENKAVPIKGNSIGEILLVASATIGIEVGLYLVGSKLVVPKIKGLFKKKDTPVEEEEQVEETED